MEIKHLSCVSLTNIVNNHIQFRRYSMYICMRIPLGMFKLILKLRTLFKIKNNCFYDFNKNELL